MRLGGFMTLMLLGIGLAAFIVAVFVYSNQENNDYSKLIKEIKDVKADTLSGGREMGQLREELEVQGKLLESLASRLQTFEPKDKIPDRPSPIIPTRIEANVTGRDRVTVQFDKPIEVEIIQPPPLLKKAGVKPKAVKKTKKK